MPDEIAAARPAYHHGDLRAALLRASLELIEIGGLEALSLREAARRAGVTHGAPSHHFGDKDGLLAALAEQGFAGLREALQTAGPSEMPRAAGLSEMRAVPQGAGQREMRAGRSASDVPRAGAALAEAGAAYVRFAQENRALFLVMFRPGGARTGEAFAAVRESLGADEALALLAWSAMHGLASLSLEGAPGAPRAGLERLAQDALGLLSRLSPSSEPARKKRGQRERASRR